MIANTLNKSIEFYLIMLLKVRNLNNSAWLIVPKICNSQHLYNIHNLLLLYFSQDYNLASHATYNKCVHFILRTTDFFDKLFMAILFLSQSFCHKSVERMLPKKYILMKMPELGIKPRPLVY